MGQPEEDRDQYMRDEAIDNNVIRSFWQHYRRTSRDDLAARWHTHSGEGMNIYEGMGGPYTTIKKSLAIFCLFFHHVLITLTSRTLPFFLPGIIGYSITMHAVLLSHMELVQPSQPREYRRRKR
jgi:hypothetical protein